MENISLFKNQAMLDLHLLTISSERALYCLQFVMVGSGSYLDLDEHWKTVKFVF